MFLALFQRVVTKRDWSCFAYCLMDNHYHLVLATASPDLSSGLQYLNGSYATWFNTRHGWTGHLFQGRFHSVLVESDWHFLELARYLARNPVRAGLAQSAADWSWGSYAFVARGQPAPVRGCDHILRHFGTSAQKARETLVRFVESNV